MEQCALFGTRLEREFEEFDRAHPEVYRYVVKFVGEAWSAGRRHYGIAAIIGRVRWHMQVERRDGEFKVNNNHRAYYARKLIREFPEYANFFETRAVRED